jgi:hypothetical protein
MLKSTHTHMPVVTTSQSKREPRRILLTAMAPSIAPTVNGSDIDLGSGCVANVIFECEYRCSASD